jgi:hypothetical protein
MRLKEARSTSPRKRAAECSPERKPGVSASVDDSSPARGERGYQLFFQTRTFTVALFEGFGLLISAFTQGSRPGLHSAAICDGSLSGLSKRTTNPTD